MFGPDDAVAALAKGATTEQEEENLGLVPRSVITMIEHINDEMEKNADNALEFSLKMNMVEI
jgi:hypothetical protein